MVKIRDSRIELLRIVLMWTVMAHHLLFTTLILFPYFLVRLLGFSTISFLSNWKNCGSAVLHSNAVKLLSKIV